MLPEALLTDSMGGYITNQPQLPRATRQHQLVPVTGLYNTMPTRLLTVTPGLDDVNFTSQHQLPSATVTNNQNYRSMETYTVA